MTYSLYPSRSSFGPPVALKVLLVDDDRTTLEIIRAVLEDEGHVVVCLDRPFGATPTMLQYKPDVVLLDVRMPGLDGVELARLMKTQSAFAPDCVILHSSLPREELSDLTRSVGVLGAIPKTDNIQAFLEDFRRLIYEHKRRTYVKGR